MYSDFFFFLFIGIYHITSPYGIILFVFFLRIYSFCGFILFQPVRKLSPFFNLSAPLTLVTNCSKLRGYSLLSSLVVAPPLPLRWAASTRFVSAVVPSG